MHVWPNLRVLGCWLGGSAGLQARRLREFFGQDVALRDPGFRASEATMALPFRDESAAGILATQVNFYEFIPENQADDEIPTVLEAHELRAGKKLFYPSHDSGWSLPIQNQRHYSSRRLPQ